MAIRMVTSPMTSSDLRSRPQRAQGPISRKQLGVLFSNNR